MYAGNNPTALQSQNWIKEALIRLMKEKEYTKITVKDICAEADLVRQTFYNCFDSKEEVLRFSIRSKYEEQFAFLCQKGSISLEEVVEAFAVVLNAEKELLDLMIKNNLDGVIADEIARCVRMFAGQFAKEDDLHLSYSEALLSGALAHLLLHWFKEDMDISVEEIMRIVAQFMTGKLFTID